MSLHSINKSPAQAAALFSDCLRTLAAGDALLLLEDAVHAAAGDASLLREIPGGVHLYALAEDLAARGISARIRPEFCAVSYREFVGLCLAHDRVVNWN